MTANPAPPLVVRDNPDRNRFEAFLGDDLAGVVEYIPLVGKIIATHTEVLPKFEGRGVANGLVTAMLDQLRDGGRQVQPLCPFVTSYLRRHPEYDDVVDPTTPH